MFGGTPSNLGMTFLETDRLEVITGVNLPMLIKLANLKKSANLLAVAQEMRDHGRNAIWVASDLLRGEKTPV
jgi:PTS system mannose-specific IIA component